MPGLGSLSPYESWGLKGIEGEMEGGRKRDVDSLATDLSLDSGHLVLVPQLSFILNGGYMTDTHTQYVYTYNSTWNRNCTLVQNV